jgi:hypothetical protein
MWHGARWCSADLPPGVVNTAVRCPRKGAAQYHAAGPSRPAVRRTVHSQLVIAALGVEGSRVQELADSQARGHDRARLAAAIVRGVVGRANATTVDGARTDDSEVRGRREAVKMLVSSSFCARAASGCVSVELAAEVAGPVTVAAGVAPLGCKQVGY